MTVELIFSPKVSTAEFESELNAADEKIYDGTVISQAELAQYCDIVKKVLCEGESKFTEFARDGGCEVSVSFVSNEEIREINAEQRDIDKATDVLSFPFMQLHEGDGDIDEMDLNPDTAAIMLGDIVISVEKAEEQAEEYGHSTEREVAFLVCHGFLHLMGFDHMEKDEEKRMFAKADEILNGLGYTR
ncbi:MAG: rRNA maturation RNase YbeY [Ruminococcaceae bacterium]|nr:rRNA maturation RNase YbeY [Oscillospiraceae bacterium]